MNKVTVQAAFFGSLMLLSAVLPSGVATANTLPLGTPCEATAARVHVTGFKDRTGNLRVQVYGSNPTEFLESGKKVVRVEGEVSPAGDMNVCVPLPGPGTYALVVLHDRDANGRLSVWSDGVGFSRNPKLGLSKPDFSAVKVTLPSGTTDINVILNYRQGLSVRPLKAAG
jgi:uncharacterized protein (DUF2141 family)